MKKLLMHFTITLCCKAHLLYIFESNPLWLTVYMTIFAATAILKYFYIENFSGVSSFEIVAAFLTTLIFHLTLYLVNKG